MLSMKYSNCPWNFKAQKIFIRAKKNLGEILNLEDEFS